MKEYNLTTKMRAYQWDELTDEQREVLELAKEQTKHSYCPYSGFHVGAAAKLGNCCPLPERGRPRPPTPRPLPKWLNSDWSDPSANVSGKRAV